MASLRNSRAPATKKSTHLRAVRLSGRRAWLLKEGGYLTRERKDELFTEALKLIGIHLDEEENAARALRQHLGMTDEEIAECGFAEECDTKTRLEHKLRECLKDYMDAWLQKEPLDLVERSDEISAIRSLAADLPDMLNQGEMEYLLRFKNPLEVASDARCGSALVEIGEEEFRQVLFETRERYDLDEHYELTDAAAARKALKVDRKPRQKHRLPER